MNEPTLNSESGLIRLRIDLSYDGTNYAGWAKQPDQRTIQGEIEAALAKIVGSEIEAVTGGRTDAGVHAVGQVIHIDLPQGSTEVENLAFRLNQILEGDIRINKCAIAPKDFHARFSALSRTYIYKIIDGLGVVPPPARFDTATWFRKLDENLMNEACAQILGKHDFKAFCKFNPDQSTERTLLEFKWERDAGVLVARVKANAFCHSMVRNLIGAAVCIGESRFEKEWILKVLQEQERVSNSYVFPASGLTLLSIEY